jgi:hypothetical protein
VSGVLQQPSLPMMNGLPRFARRVAKWPRSGTKLLTELTGLADDGHPICDAGSVGSSPK